MSTGNKLWYLASPYYSPSVRWERYTQVCLAAGQLIRAGVMVFSPIAHSHGIYDQCPDIGGSWEDWAQWNAEMILCCDGCIVLALDGWEASVGIKAEIEAFHRQNKPIVYTNPKLISTAIAYIKGGWVDAKGGLL